MVNRAIWILTPNHANLCDLGLLNLFTPLFFLRYAGRYYSQCIDETTKREKLNNLSTDPQLVSNTTRIQNQANGVQNSRDSGAWCTGKTQRDPVEREVGEGIRMGNTCKSIANSCQCMTKTTTIL